MFYLVHNVDQSSPDHTCTCHPRDHTRLHSHMCKNSDTVVRIAPLDTLHKKQSIRNSLWCKTNAQLQNKAVDKYEIKWLLCLGMVTLIRLWIQLDVSALRSIDSVFQQVGKICLQFELEGNHMRLVYQTQIDPRPA